MADNIKVEVAYATDEQQKIISLNVVIGTTALQAVEQSKIEQFFPEIDLANLTIGIFSKKCTLDTQLRQDDRVEIYRPLIADPKEVRKQRAAAGKRMKKGGGDK